jgi:tRNA-dihydrouridine synthase C
MLNYIQALYDATAAFHPRFDVRPHVQKMKRYMVFITTGIGEGQLEHRIRRVTTEDEFFTACRDHLDHDEPLSERPPEDSHVFCGFAALK